MSKSTLTPPRNLYCRQQSLAAGRVTRKFDVIDLGLSPNNVIAQEGQPMCSGRSASTHLIKQSPLPKISPLDRVLTSLFPSLVFFFAASTRAAESVPDRAGLIWPLILATTSVLAALSALWFAARYRRRFLAAESALAAQADDNIRLRNSRALLDALFQTVPVVVSVKDESGRILMINAECQRFHGCNADAFVGRTDFDLYPQDQAERIRAQDIACLERGECHVDIEYFTNIDGTSSWVEKRKTSVTLPDGRRAIVTALHDITALRQAQTEALEAKSFLHSIIDAIPNGVFVKDDRHRWIVTNKKFGHYIDAEPEDLLGKTDFDYFPPDEATIAWSQDDEVLATGKSIVVEQEMRLPSGQSGWYEKTKSVLEVSDGRRFVVGLARDVTAIRRAERALKESEARWSAVVASMTEGIVVIDDHGRIEAANRALHEMFGYPENSLLGENISILVPGPHHEHHDGYLGRYRAGGPHKVVGKVRNVEGRRRDGALVPMELSVSESMSGRRRLLTGIARDLTGKMRHRDISRQTERVAHIGGWELDLVGNALFWTEETFRIHEVDEETFIPTVEAAYSFYLPEDRAQISGVVQKAIVDGQAYDVLLRIITGKGRLRWVRSVGNVVVRDGKAVKLYGAFQDVTAQKEIDDELKRHRDNLQEMVTERTRELQAAKDAAEAAARVKTAFMTNMSHELRTPLHAIQSFSELALKRTRSGDAEKAVSFLDRIARSTRRLNDFLSDVFYIVDLESDAAPLLCTTQNLSTLIREAVSREREGAAERRIDIQVPADTRDVLSNVDRDRILHVLQKLLRNAITFSPAGGQIRIRLYRSNDGASLNCIAIEDQGPGIPEGETDSIFEKFVQSSTTASGAGGRGLGLTICRLIARAHGGDVTATNNASQGACFIVTLPCLEPAVDDADIAHLVR